MKLPLIALAFILSLSSIACSRKNSNPPPPPPAAQDTAETTPASGAAANSSGLAGWMGLSALPLKKEGEPGNEKYYWSPRSAEAQVALICEPCEEWKKVEPGTAYSASAAGPGGMGFQGEIQFLKVDEIPYGCEEHTAPMALFTAPKRLPEGPVWISPKTKSPATALELSKMNVNKAGGPSLFKKNLASWVLGDLTLTFKRTIPTKADLAISNPQKILFKKTYETYAWPDEEKIEIDFSSEAAPPGIPQPIGGFRFANPVATAVVFLDPGFEGIGFRAVVIGPVQAEEKDLVSAYWCAY